MFVHTHTHTKSVVQTHGYRELRNGVTAVGAIYGKDNEPGTGTQDHNGYVKGIDLRNYFSLPHKTTNSHCVKFVVYCLNCCNATNFETANELNGVFNKQDR
jgi:hypothetical protein